MTNTIKLKRGSGSDPSASDMVVGEPVLRSATAELVFKKDDGSVAKVSGGGGGGSSFKYLALLVLVAVTLPAPKDAISLATGKRPVILLKASAKPSILF